MKNNRRILTIITIATLSAITIIGCNKGDKDTDKHNEIVDTDAVTESTNEEIDTNNSAENESTVNESTANDSTDASVSNEDDSAVQDSQEDGKDNQTTESDKNTTEDTSGEIELPIYTMNDDTLETEDVIAYVPKNTTITAEVIVNKVVETFSANSYEVRVQSVTQKDDTVIVNFEKNSAPVTGVGASVEGTTLDCISYSLLDNLSTCKKVIFRIDGEAYISGHIEMGINEPYITGNTN